MAKKYKSTILKPAAYIYTKFKLYGSIYKSNLSLDLNHLHIFIVTTNQFLQCGILNITMCLSSTMQKVARLTKLITIHCKIINTGVNRGPLQVNVKF